jgi:hypothetical protein
MLCFNGGRDGGLHGGVFIGSIASACVCMVFFFDLKRKREILNVSSEKKKQNKSASSVIGIFIIV